jgi:hypothetical protein
MQFWKDCSIYNCIKNLAWTWVNITKGMINNLGMDEMTLRTSLKWFLTAVV